MSPTEALVEAPTATGESPPAGGTVYFNQPWVVIVGVCEAGKGGGRDGQCERRLVAMVFEKGFAPVG